MSRRGARAPRLPRSGQVHDPMCPDRLYHHAGVRCPTFGGVR